MKDKLVPLVAEYLAADPASIDDGFRFSGARFQGSIGMLKFQAFARRRLGYPVPTLPYGASLAEAAAAFAGGKSGVSVSAKETIGTGTEADAIAAAIAAGGAPAPGGPVGVDIELIAALPQATDYRGHEFYSATFTPTEIAYCVLRPEPLMHFCGLFSAKESLKKAAPEFLSLPFNAIEIRHDRQGKPYYAKAGNQALPPFSLSISHTADQAVAVALGNKR